MAPHEQQHEIVILSAMRTPIGKFLGGLAPVSAPRLGAAAIKAALERAGVDNTAIDQAIMGNVLQAGVGQAPARQAARYAGLPDHTGAITINKVCGSGLRAVMDAANGIRAGEWNMVIAGGMESMSNAPHLLERSRAGYRMGNVTMADAMIKDGLWDPYGDKHMGNCAELCAQRYQFTREAQDAFARQSYERARNAVQTNLFSNEITAISVPSGKDQSVQVGQDEEPFGAPIEKMASLKPAFDKNGTITAANASKLNDGAAALVIAHADVARKLTQRDGSERSNHGSNAYKPLARIVAYATAAHEPEWFTTAPVPATKLALQRAGLKAHDIDRWEINEAFAVVTMAAMRDLELDPARVNVCGGAVALGHPIGGSGARILTTLVHTLIRDNVRYGCATICIGGGEGVAVIIENLTR